MVQKTSNHLLGGMMESKKASILKPILICLCNFNFLGIGYLLIGQKKRWLIAFGGTVAVLLAAYFANAPKNPWLWAGVYATILIAMMVDLWLLLKKDPALCDKVLKNNMNLLIITAVLLVVLFGGGFYSYRWMAEKLYREGSLAYLKDDFYTAFKDLYSDSHLYRLSLNPTVLQAQQLLGEVSLIIDSQNKVKGGDFVAASDLVAKFQKLYPDSSKLDQVKNIGIDAYIGAAKQLTENAEFEAAVGKIDALREFLPLQAEERKAEIDEVLAANYLAWGQDLYTKKEFASSIEKFEIVTNDFNTSESYTEAFSGASLAHYDYATQLASEQNYDLAWEQYQSIFNNYSSGAEYSKSKTEVADMLLDWGGSLLDQDHFILALEKFNLVGEYSSAADLLSAAQEQKDATIVLLANDSGEDGQSVISTATNAACNGELVTDPSIGILEEEPKKAMACDSYALTLPDEVIADKPGNLAYVVERVDDSRRVQSCDYVTSIDRRVLERWQYYSAITVKEVLTGKTVYEKTFYGPSPESCPYEYYFGSMTEYLYGDYVDDEKITVWLGEVLQ